MEGLKILVVEDHPELAMLTIETLEHLGVHADLAKNGKEAVDYLQGTKPDLMLLDLGLPDISGWEILKHARELYGDFGLPIIVTTAFSDHTNRIVGKLEHVNRYLIKPFRAQNLLETIGEVLELYKVGA